MLSIEDVKLSKDCTGCGACVQICPKHCIKMIADKEGFLYPDIDNNICIKCDICNRTCPEIISRQKHKFIQKAYISVNKNKESLLNSSSGGVFAALANLILKMDGFVYGCTLDSKFKVIHTDIQYIEDIPKLQGSKYVQSNTLNTFFEVKTKLSHGDLVLYSGTPCQIAGLKSFLKKEYNNLITADVICHGVASQSFFDGYIQWLKKLLNGNIIEFYFRDKHKYGWGCTGAVKYIKNSKIYNKNIIPPENYYYYYFLKGYIYRESCYKCKYANINRLADFTMGDFWGIERYISKFPSEDGVSVMLVNSQKGNKLLKKLKSEMNISEIPIENVVRENHQLNNPMIRNNIRDEIYRQFIDGGFEAVASAFNNNNKIKRRLSALKARMPKKVKKAFKVIKFKVKG